MNRKKINCQNQHLSFINTIRNQKTHLLNLRKIKSTLKTTFRQKSLKRPSSQQFKFNCSSLHFSRIVEQQNHKLVLRLLQVKPAVKSINFSYLKMINHQQKQKKDRSRYKQLDYTVQAEKMIRGQKIYLNRLINHRSYQNINNFTYGDSESVLRRKPIKKYINFIQNPCNQTIRNKNFRCYQIR